MIFDRARCLVLAGILGTIPASGLDPRALFSQYVHRVWSPAEGLASNYPLAVAQTPDGLLWVASDSGLARLDGRSAHVFEHRTSPVIRTNSFYTLASDRAGSLWAGLNRGGGLIRVQRSPNLALSKSHGLLHASVIQLAPSSNGGVWAATLGGLHEITPNGNIRVELPNVVVTAVLQDRQNRLWAATANGLKLQEQGQWQTLPNNPGGRIFKIVEDRSGRIWFGGTRGLWFWDGAKPVFIGESLLRGDNILSLAVDPDAGLWVGTSQGRLFRTSPSGLEPVPFSGEAAINDLFFDREGSLWISTQGNGLHQISDPPIRMFASPEGLLGDAARAVFQDNGGNLWAATVKGVSVRTPGSPRFVPVPELPAGSSILAQDPSGALVLTSVTGGIAFWRPGSRPRWKFTLNDEPIMSVAITAPGHGYAGTDRHLYQFDAARIIKVPGIIGPVRQLAAGQREGPMVLWAAAANGVWRIQGGPRQPVIPGRTTDLWIAPDGSVWAGTPESGILWWRDGASGKLDPSLLPSDGAISLAGDAESLYAGTGRGIVQIPLTGPAPAAPLRIYGPPEGLRSPLRAVPARTPAAQNATAQTTGPTATPSPWRTLLSDAPLRWYLTAEILFCLTYWQFTSSLALGLQREHAHSPQWFGNLVVINSWLTVIGQAAWLRVIDRIPLQTQLLGGLATMATGFLLFARAQTWWAFVLAMILFTAGSSILLLASQYLLERLARRGPSGTYFGLGESRTFGTMLSAPLGGILLDSGGLALVMTSMPAVLAAAACAYRFALTRPQPYFNSTIVAPAPPSLGGAG